MPYAMVIAPCGICRHSFGLNPERVPSLRVKGYGWQLWAVSCRPDAVIYHADAEARPLCQLCWQDAQRRRRQRGVEPMPDPPSGAWEPFEVESMEDRPTDVPGGAVFFAPLTSTTRTRRL